MLKSHSEAKCYSIFSAILILEQKIWKVIEVWVVDANSLTSGKIRNNYWDHFAKKSKPINDEWIKVW